MAALDVSCAGGCQLWGGAAARAGVSGRGGAELGRLASTWSRAMRTAPRTTAWCRVDIATGAGRR